MSGGDLETPVSSFGGDELGSLANELDHLRLALSETIRQEQESRTANQDLITAMSHDLRTPLTVLTGYLEVLHLGHNPSKHEEYVNRCLQKTSDLRELTDRMFEYALVFDDRTAAQITEIPSDFLYRCINENTEYLRLTGRTVHIMSDGRFSASLHASDRPFDDGEPARPLPLPRFSILADSMMLKRVFSNLFSNIIKYGDKKEPVEITGSLEDSKFVIILKNAIKLDASNIESNQIGLKSVSKMLTQNGRKLSLRHRKQHVLC